MFAKLWNDESGVIAVEYLFLVTIVGLGLVIGFSNLEAAINSEYTELGNAILGLSQAYSIDTQTGCKASKQGSNVTDTASTLGWGHTAAAASSVNVPPCGN